MKNINAHSISLLILNIAILSSCSTAIEVTNIDYGSILFEGTENRIKLSKLSNSKTYLLALNDSTKVKYEKDCDCFPYVPNVSGKDLGKLKIFKNEKAIDSVEIKTYPIPDPKLYLNSRTQSDITIELAELKMLDIIEVKCWLNL